ncbi:hypothetical protein [Leeia aquatica]|uniref:Uncharacterized protein n=1 Tax=Leeia aquatica TaxID=2725557 RepID=A0A847SCK1_9NEIS|nr:hypothetical protein [Leeia aquatica]NLR73682.1 hypothetical protein [Leeia aquatica]
MHNIEIESALKLISANLPVDWLKNEILYRSFDGAIDLTERYQKNNSDDWEAFDAGGFDLMDILDRHRDESGDHGTEKWTQIRLSMRKGALPEVTYGYGDPKILY